MTKPKIIINENLNEQILHYLAIASCITNSFYENKNFYVLPHKILHSKSIYFPKPNENINDLVWEKCNYDLLSKKELTKTIEQIKEQFTLPEHQKINRDKLLKVFPSFWEELSRFIPKFTDNVEEILISPTAFGSWGSERSSWKKGSNPIQIYLRDDADISEVFYLILMERCNKFYSKYQYTDVKTNRWEIINTIPRFLTQETVLSKYYKNSLGLELLDSPSMNAQLEKESKEYLDELGFGDDITINVDSKNIFINKRRINLAPAEVKLFNLLYLKKKLIVSYDEISELFWDNEAAERFSLYAISKSISRIRKEIKVAGIKRELIHTQKGEGYMLS